MENVMHFLEHELQASDFTLRIFYRMRLCMYFIYL